MHSALGIAIPVVFFTGIGMLFHKKTRLYARLFLMLAVFLLVTATKNRPAERPDTPPSPTAKGVPATPSGDDGEHSAGPVDGTPIKR